MWIVKVKHQQEELRRQEFAKCGPAFLLYLHWIDRHNHEHTIYLKKMESTHQEPTVHLSKPGRLSTNA